MFGRLDVHELSEWVEQTPDDVWREVQRARRSEDSKDSEIARLRAALKPFAAMARVCIDHANDHDFSDTMAAMWTPSYVRPFVEVSVADCRAALKALEDT